LHSVHTARYSTLLPPGRSESKTELSGLGKGFLLSAKERQKQKQKQRKKEEKQAEQDEKEAQLFQQLEELQRLEEMTSGNTHHAGSQEADLLDIDDGDDYGQGAADPDEEKQRILTAQHVLQDLANGFSGEDTPEDEEESEVMGGSDTSLFDALLRLEADEKEGMRPEDQLEAPDGPKSVWDPDRDCSNAQPQQTLLQPTKVPMQKNVEVPKNVAFSGVISESGDKKKKEAPQTAPKKMSRFMARKLAEQKQDGAKAL